MVCFFPRTRARKLPNPFGRPKIASDEENVSALHRLQRHVLIFVYGKYLKSLHSRSELSEKFPHGNSRTGSSPQNGYRTKWQTFWKHSGLRLPHRHAQSRNITARNVWRIWAQEMKPGNMFARKRQHIILLGLEDQIYQVCSLGVDYFGHVSVIKDVL